MTEQLGPLTSMICLDFGLGWQTCTDLEFEHSPIESSMHIDRTWNGAAEDMSDPAFDLFAVSIKSQGAGELRAPALDRLRRLDEFVCVPTFEFVDTIRATGTTRTLIRDPYEPSIRVLDEAFNDIPFSVSGRVITLSSPATSTLRIYYRPILSLKVFAPWKETFVESAAEVSWELYCEEVGGPDE